MKAKILQRIFEIVSRYDVRFVYVHRKEWYLQLIEDRDVIEERERDPYGVMDFAGWDLVKIVTRLPQGFTFLK